MDKKCILIPLSMLILLAGCGGESYVEEKTMLSTATKAMETFTAAIESADTPELVAQALGTFTGAFEKLVPAMKKMKEEHADWETSPPDALKDTFAQFESASDKFQGAMPKVMQFVGQHADNAALQSAVSKFRDVAAML